MDLEAVAQVQFATEDGSAAHSTEFLRIKRLGSRALLSMKEVVDRVGEETSRTWIEFVVFESGDILDCQARLDASLKQIHDDKPGLAIALYSKRLAGSQDVDRESVYNALNDAGAALWIIGYLPLISYLDRASEIQVAPLDASLRAGQAKIQADSDYGTVKLTASQSSGWLPQSFEIVKEPHHKTIGGLVSDVYQNSVNSVVWTGESKDFVTDSDGRWAPTQLIVQRRTNWKNKPVTTETTTIEFDKVMFDPLLHDIDFKTDIVAPQGYPVTIMGANHLPYKWDGEAVVPGVPDRPALPSATASKALRKSARGQRTQTVLIAFNAAVLAFVFMVLWWRSRKKSRSIV